MQRNQVVTNTTQPDPSFCYPVNYGVGACRMWDAGIGSCATSTPEPWCFHVWCYVDPMNCDTGDVAESAFFQKAHGSNPHFSYMACGVPQEDNPYFTLWVPTHLIAAAVAVGTLVPLIAFVLWRVACSKLPVAAALGPPWMGIWLTMAVCYVLDIVGFDTRVPNFPQKGTTHAVLEAIALLFFLLLVHRVLALIDSSLQHLRLARHEEHGRRKEFQILESVLLYQKMCINSWGDVLMDLWRPIYQLSTVILFTIWILRVLSFPFLSDLVSGGFIGIIFIGGLGGLFSFKEDVVAAIALAMERPFRVADIISLHSCSNHLGAMNAIAVGFVEKVGILHIAIRNFDMRLQYVPTRIVAQGTIKNWNARRYKMSHWTVVLSMRTSPESVKAFRDGVEQILRSHPTCKTDGYVKVCVGKLAAGGFELEVVCFTKPHADHHAFKLEMNMAMSRLASHLGVEFVWENISKESANVSVPTFQYAAAEADGTPNEIKDLLFHGRFTKGNLIGKLKQHRTVKLSRSFGQEAVDASISFDLLFTLPLSHPAIVADKEINWTPKHSELKGELQVMVDVGHMGPLMPGRSLFGGSVDVFVVATVARQGGKASDGTVTVDSSAASVAGGAGRRAGDEVLACCRSPTHRLMKSGEVTWGETLALGEVALPRPGDGTEARPLVLQLVVGLAGASGSVKVLGVAERPLMELVQDAWKDQHVKVEGLSSKVEGLPKEAQGLSSNAL